MKDAAGHFSLAAKSVSYFRVLDTQNILGMHVYDLYVKAAAGLNAVLNQRIGEERGAPIAIQTPKLIEVFGDFIDFAIQIRTQT